MRLRESFSATAPLTPRSGIRSPEVSGSGRAGVEGTAAASSSAALIADSTSVRRISPSRPDPATCRRSRPCCRASFLTSGEMTATGP